VSQAAIARHAEAVRRCARSGLAPIPLYHPFAYAPGPDWAAARPVSETEKFVRLAVTKLQKAQGISS
jgi:hypothetical protein